jgi:hypothetical protein
MLLLDSEALPRSRTAPRLVAIGSVRLEKG